MGAAMAPAAADTITKHFKDTGRQAKDYDLIVTGDLASVGLPIAKDLCNKMMSSWTVRCLQTAA